MWHWLPLLFLILQCDKATAGITCERHTLEVANITATNFPVPIRSGSRVTLVCLEGYKFTDMERNKTIDCKREGWSSSPSVCEEHCDEMPVMDNAVVVNGTTRVGSTVTLECNVGYELPDGSKEINNTCLVGRRWSVDHLPQCHIVNCPLLPIYPHQHLNNKSTTFNTSVIFWCDYGHTLPDGTTARKIRCKENGNWTATLPKCEAVRCSEVTLPVLCSRNTSSSDYGTYVKYTCETDTRMRDGATSRIVRCDGNKLWSDNVTDCSANRCQPLIFVANTTCDDPDAENGSSVTVKCIKGHRFLPDHERSKVIRCLHDLSWSPILEGCEPLYCKTMPDAGQHNRALDTSSRLLETVVIYDCDPGHYFNQESSQQRIVIECVEDLEEVNPVWTPTPIPDCHPAECVDPPDIGNGTQTPAPRGPYVYPHPVKYRCNDGFLFSDGYRKRSIKCDETGNWTSTDVTCHRDRCTPVPDVLNTVADTTITAWFMNVTYTCAIGHEWPLPKTYHGIMCQQDGSWNETASSIPSCDAKLCEMVNATRHSTANTTDNVYNTYVQHACDVGHKFADGDTEYVRWCNPDGLWEPDVLESCNVNHCSEIAYIENATVSTNETSYDTIANVSCMPGYQFPDKTKEKAIRCTANETWSDILPNCEVVFCQPVPSWAETYFNSTDNNYLSVIVYSCKPGSKFVDVKEDPRVERTSLCNITKDWMPPITDCVAEQKIGASLKGITYESPSSVKIGTLSWFILGVILGGTVLLDLSKIMSDLRMMRDNIGYMIRHRGGRDE